MSSNRPVFDDAVAVLREAVAATALAMRAEELLGRELTMLRTLTISRVEWMQRLDTAVIRAAYQVATLKEPQP